MYIYVYLFSVSSDRYDPVLMESTELLETRAPPVALRHVELDVLRFLQPLGEENSTAEQCFRSHSRNSVLQGLPFGGVPTVLFINAVLWMVQTLTHSQQEVCLLICPIAAFPSFLKTCALVIIASRKH